MGLYERIQGSEEPKLPVHEFMGVMQEYMLGNMTGAEATAALGLSASEGQEALALRDRILTESSASSGIQRRVKAMEIERVLHLLEAGLAPFHTVAAVKSRLGVV